MLENQNRKIRCCFFYVLKKEQNKSLVNYLFTLEYIIRKCYTENVSIVDEKYMFLLYFYKVQSMER